MPFAEVTPDSRLAEDQEALRLIAQSKKRGLGSLKIPRLQGTWAAKLGIVSSLKSRELISLVFHCDQANEVSENSRLGDSRGGCREMRPDSRDD